MYARVGKISGAAGSKNPLRSDPSGALVMMATGKYREATEAGRVYVAANQAAVALTAAFALTYTGLVVYNPPTSGKNAAFLGCGFAYTLAASATTVIGLMTGLDAGDAAAAIVPRNRLKGGPASAMVVDNGCTLVGTPVLEQVLGHVSSVATTASEPVGGPYDLDGSLILTPGSYVAFYSLNANTAGPICCFMWEEYDS